MREVANQIEYDYADLDEAFPPCDPGVTPFGSRILVQMRTPKEQTKGGLYLPTEVRETEVYNTQVGKVLAVGPLAFHNRNTMEVWPEGQWCKPGDFVRVPKWGGDRWAVKTLRGDDDAFVVIFNDLDIVGHIYGDPLAMKAYI